MGIQIFIHLKKKKYSLMSIVFNFLSNDEYEIVKLKKIKNKKDYSRMIIAHV